MCQDLYRWSVFSSFFFSAQDLNLEPFAIQFSSIQCSNSMIGHIHGLVKYFSAILMLPCCCVSKNLHKRYYTSVLSISLKRQLVHFGRQPCEKHTSSAFISPSHIP